MPPQLLKPCYPCYSGNTSIPPGRGKVFSSRRSNRGGPKNCRGPLADLFGESRDHAATFEAVLEVLPEPYPQLPARLLQARERIPAPPTRLAARAAAYLPLLHVIPDVVLAGVVVQRQLRTCQHAQQLRLVRRQTLQRPVDRHEIRLGGEQLVETRFQPRLLLRARRCLVRLQLGVVVPHLGPHPLQSLPILVV